MPYDKRIIKDTLSEFENKSKIAEGNAERLKGTLYKKISGLEEIDEKLSRAQVDIVNAIIEGRTDIRELVAKISSQNLLLQEKRCVLLAKYGYPPDCTDPKYDCIVCSDTGYNGDAPCVCLKKALSMASLEFSGLKDIVSEQSFDNFKLEYYSKSKNEYDLSPYENMERIYKICKRFAENFNNPGSEKNLFFIGDTGLGKTHLSSAIAYEVISSGSEVIYDSAQTIIYSFEKERFSRIADVSDMCEKFLTCDLLIIDDLGTEYSGTMSVSALYNIINKRGIEKKGTIISTNLSLPVLQKKYDDRIISRLLGGFRVLNFYGDNIRMLKMGK